MIWKQNSNGWEVVNLHNSQRGNVGFIVANGPSLDRMPKTLQGPGRCVIAINNAYPSIRPDYWLGMDLFDRFHPHLSHEAFPKIVRTWNYLSQPNMLVADLAEKGPFYNNQNSGDPFLWQKDTLRVAIQFALYLGITHLVFIGVDLDLSAGDYAGGVTQSEEQRALNALLHEQLFQWFKLFSKENPQIRLNSASESSRLNSIMSHVPIEAALALCEAGL